MIVFVVVKTTPARSIRRRDISSCISYDEPEASMTLGDHLKTGHRGSPQNRPTGLTQDKLIYTPLAGRLAMDFSTIGKCPDIY
jgi:hypothetical protein